MGTEALADDGLVRRSYGIALRSINEQTRSVDVVASTDAIDSYDEIVAQNWRLERYAANPVVLFAHNSRELPIGRAKGTRVESGALVSTFLFASQKANPLAEQVWNSILEETLKGVSVGFRPNDVRYEKRDGREVYVLDDNELYEISMTPVPSNPEGLTRSTGGLWVPRDPKWFVDMKSRACAQTRKAGELPSRDEVTQMDPEKLKAELAAKQAELDTAQKAAAQKDARIGDLELENRGLRARAENAEKSLSEERKRSEKLDAEAVEADVQSQVGKKITPAQKDEFIELRKAYGKAKFLSFVGKFADLKLTESKVEGEGSETNTNTAKKSASASSKLLTKAHSVARAAERGE